MNKDKCIKVTDFTDIISRTLELAADVAVIASKHYDKSVTDQPTIEDNVTLKERQPKVCVPRMTVDIDKYEGRHSDEWLHRQSIWRVYILIASADLRTIPTYDELTDYVNTHVPAYMSAPVDRKFVYNAVYRYHLRHLVAVTH